MTLTQLRYLCEIVRQGLHLSRAAEALHTSQPGVSKQIQLLERELGCAIFKRQRNRLLDLTPVGQDVLNYAQRALIEVENIRNVSRGSYEEASGTIVIACTLVQARYVLPSVIDRFMKRYPNARLEFFQGPRQQVFAKVDAGDADIGIGGDRGVSVQNVTMLDYGTLHYTIVAKPGHPLLRLQKPTLRDVAAYPIIAHMFEPDGQWKLVDVFKKNGLSPNIVFRAADADVGKAYVELGIGIAVLSSASFEKKRDRLLRAINADHLFAPEPLFIGFHRKRRLSRHLVELIKMLAPALTVAEIEAAASHH
jgi:LysR family cys regulon transcriptional activator